MYGGRRRGRECVYMWGGGERENERGNEREEEREEERGQRSSGVAATPAGCCPAGRVHCAAERDPRWSTAAQSHFQSKDQSTGVGAWQGVWSTSPRHHHDRVRGTYSSAEFRVTLFHGKRHLCPCINLEGSACPAGLPQWLSW